MRLYQILLTLFSLLSLVNARVGGGTVTTENDEKGQRKLQKGYYNYNYNYNYYYNYNYRTSRQYRPPRRRGGYYGKSAKTGYYGKAAKNYNYYYNNQRNYQWNYVNNGRRYYGERYYPGNNIFLRNYEPWSADTIDSYLYQRRGYRWGYWY